MQPQSNRILTMNFTKLKILTLLTLTLTTQSFAQQSYKLWYDKPATNWEKEALPIGNGNLGAMVFGGIDQEHIQFNQDSLWIGDESETGSYQAFGDFYITFNNNAQTSGISDPDKNPTSSTQAIEKSLDNNPATKWCIDLKHKKQITWQLTLPQTPSTPLTQYTITSANDVPARDPQTWTLYASNDGSNWIALDKQKINKPFAKRHQSKTFKFKNKKTYKSYRITFTPSKASHFQLADIQLGNPNNKTYTNKTKPINTKNYKRQLDITKALHTITYTDQDTNYKREYFASNPANLLIFHFTADKKNAYNATIKLTDMHKAKITAKRAYTYAAQTGSLIKNINTKIPINAAIITAKGKLNGYAYKSPTTLKNIYDINLKYESQTKITHIGGSIKVNPDNTVTLKDVTSFTILLAADTNYINKRSQKWTTTLPHKRNTNNLNMASIFTYNQLLKKHIKDYQSLASRLSLNLGQTAQALASLPTDQRLKKYKENAKDPDLEELLFQYARYLMISSSRPGSLPANLQGLWNNSNSPPWRSDYHTDVNVQMNYWFVDQANLSECFQPLTEWLHSIRQVRTEATFKKYGVRGWATRSENGIFGGASYKWVPGDASWVAQNAYDHYAFTGDKKYLRTRLYPLLKELAHYWEDSLIKRPNGTLVSPAGQSPEHGPHVQGNSYDIQLAYDLFTNYIQCAKDLNIDADYRKKITHMRDNLLKPQIGKWGQLQEWEEDRDNPNDKHRHLSHLIAVHPGNQISPITTPKLAQAAKVSMNGRGDGATGWSKGWKINVWARLHDGNRAYKLLSEQLKGNFYQNLYGFHPPFQIDGNFGYASGICEMLLQSQTGQIHPLPSLPDAWPTGSIKGIKARQGFIADLHWENKKLTKIIIHSKLGKTCTLRTKTPVILVVTTAENSKTIPYTKDINKNTITFKTHPNQTYIITPTTQQYLNQK